jgi:hypothetical protein
VGTGVVEFAPEIVDIEINDVAFSLGSIPPDAFKDLVTGYHLSGIAHQIFKERKLARAEFDLDSGTCDTMALRIERDIGYLEDARE